VKAVDPDGLFGVGFHPVANHPAVAFSQRVGETLDASHLRAVFVRTQDDLGAQDVLEFAIWK